MVIVAKEKGKATGFAARLRALRDAAGLTQAELAEAAGVQRLTLIRYESGETQPAWSIVVKLADVLGVSTEKFRDQE